MTNRVTWGLRRTPDGWKIAHEHTSAPLGDDLKGILQRS
jgi:ketosteroid isomerase-like protein